ncbi:MAG: DUF1828 domain-containing protein [Aerococcus sp.]|nr:DUF1828 domain-containing protein [Aerococcus sp.]
MVEEIVTPYFDGYGESIIIYVEYLDDGSIIVTDDGWTIDNLESHGVDVTINSGAVKTSEDNELFIHTTMANLSTAKTELVDSIQQLYRDYNSD